MVDGDSHLAMSDGSEKGTIEEVVVQESPSTCEAQPYRQDSVLGIPPSLTRQEERRLWRKIDVRLMPILTVMYLCSFVDRGNIGNSRHIHLGAGKELISRPGNAKLEGLTTQLKLSSTEYSVALVSALLCPRMSTG